MKVDKPFQMLSIYLNNILCLMQGMNSHMGFGTYIIPKRMQLAQGLLDNGMLSSCQKVIIFI